MSKFIDLGKLGRVDERDLVGAVSALHGQRQVDLSNSSFLTKTAYHLGEAIPQVSSGVRRAIESFLIIPGDREVSVISSRWSRRLETTWITRAGLHDITEQDIDNGFQLKPGGIAIKIPYFQQYINTNIITPVTVNTESKVKGVEIGGLQVDAYMVGGIAIVGNPVRMIRVTEGNQTLIGNIVDNTIAGLLVGITTAPETLALKKQLLIEDPSNGIFSLSNHVQEVFKRLAPSSIYAETGMLIRRISTDVVWSIESAKVVAAQAEAEQIKAVRGAATEGIVGGIVKGLGGPQILRDVLGIISNRGRGNSNTEQ